MSTLTFEHAASRALRLRCPQCGNGRLFSGWFRMNPRCNECSCDFTRSPGFYLGSIYVNYGFVALTLTLLYIGLHFGAGISNTWVMPLLLAYALAVPILTFRHARAWWLAMDCVFDQTGEQGEEWPPPPENYRRAESSPSRESEGTP